MEPIEKVIIFLTIVLLIIIGGMLFTKQHCFLDKDCAGFCGGNTPECNGICGNDCDDDDDGDDNYTVNSEYTISGWSKSETIPTDVDGLEIKITYSDPTIQCIQYKDNNTEQTLVASCNFYIKSNPKYVFSPINMTYRLNLIIQSPSCDQTAVVEYLNNTNNLYMLAPQELKDQIYELVMMNK